MKKFNVLNVSVGVCLLASVVMFAACKKSKFEGFEDTESGLSYKFFVKNDKGDKPKMDDVITIKLKYFTDKDSMLFDSKQIGRPFMVQIAKPAYKGSFEEGFSMMSVGDSACFMVSSDSFFVKIVKGQLPPQLKAGSFLKFYAKLEKIQSKAEMEKARAEEMKKQQEANEVRKTAETAEITKYVEENKITVKPHPSGLYFIETKKGTGAQVEKGDTVTVNYTGKLFSGKVFDSSDKSPVPVKFAIGVGNVIPGWDEALLLMHVGGKATLVIPSSMAYGERGAGPDIPAFTPLVFDVEVKAVTKKK